ncbi:translocation protein TolB [uncultured Fibrobacter sp.]|uniref:translocation protein TolB n=1 Tax=uncultured Fibrobacter sp. TaxID=261512 RepID=UPI0025EBB5EA|nr:translocation protein TolB [uncultured Fibrobacter sp.]
MKRLFVLLAFLVFSAPCVFASIDTIAVDVGISVFKTTPIGIVPFEEKPGIEWIEERPHQILTRDANLSGRFDVVASEKFNLALFSRSHADYYMTGKVSPLADGLLKVECFLYVSKSKTLRLGESYTVKQKNLRRAVHDFFDKATLCITGERGVATTRLAFVSKIDGVKQVVISDYDGFHRSQVTRDSTISMMPVWMRGNAGLVYVNFKTRRPRLYAKKFGGAEYPLFAQFDQTYSPAVNSRTGELLFSSTVDGKTDLYLGNMETGKARKFAYLKSNQTSPAWSPTASEVLFTSDRGGSPQIFVMEKDGSDLRRVTFMGRYNERASWSPNGDRIVYTSMDNGKMNIYTCALDGSDIVQLTNNAGNNEHPTWSPDGKLIAFSSNRSGTYQIYIMRFDGANVTRITQGGENTAPTWSWFNEDIKQQKKEGNQ